MPRPRPPVTVLAACFFAVLSCRQSALCLAAGDAALPNIVLVLADDQGWADVSYNTVEYQNDAYQYQWTPNRPETPNLDAMATADSSILFLRFYAGSGVCSPTRAACLTGRTPNRECITGAEGCGQKPAWSCDDHLPLPPSTFTIAEAAKLKNYSTIHIGKWHLGDFFYKGTPTTGHAAYDKWPVSNPGMHGFDEWHSTEASAASSTTNCGCNADWPKEGLGCIVGGGNWSREALDCTNYWFPDDLDDHHVPEPSRAFCRDELNGTKVVQQHCVSNLTSKITGDDSEHIMDVFEDFLKRKTAGPEQSPFLAALWLHTVHEPHPSLPQYYHAYKDAFGDPAGDYLGTLTQMDVQIGRLRDMLKQYGVHNNTMVWYTADNGPHSQGRDRQPFAALPATNGLRQCKASLYEGGIRTPGILEWPAVIKKNSATWHPAYVSDYLPTVLDILGVAHQHPDWAADGMSLLPLIQTLAADPQINDTSVRPVDHPLVFNLGGQAAIVNNQWKILRNPVVGQCTKEHGSQTGGGTMLFNLDADPTESNDLSKDPAHAQLFANMTAQLNALLASIKHSAATESMCSVPSPSPGPSPPSPTPPAPPLPPTPPQAGFEIKDRAGGCLSITSTNEHTPMALGACDGGSKWQRVGTRTGDVVGNVAVPNACLKVMEELDPAKKPCDAGRRIGLGKCNDAMISFQGGELTVTGCSQSPMCVVVAKTTLSGPGAVEPAVVFTQPCNGSSAQWTKV